MMRAIRARIAMLLSIMAGVDDLTASGQFRHASGNNCSVCRAVTQSVVDLHSEWSILRETQPRSPDARARNYASYHHDSDDAPATYQAAIETFCQQSFLSSAQQRLCYAVEPFFQAEVARWLSMGVPPERVCRKLSARNPDAYCFDAREAERQDIRPFDWHSRPPSIPEGIECSVEHRNSPAPRWVLLN